MQLPNASESVVEQKKVVEYLLSASHPDGWAKAEFFTAFGFRVDEWQVLADALKNHGRENPVTNVVASEYGVRYSVDGSLETPSSRTPTVRTVWIVEKHEPSPRLITAHPV